MARNNTDERVVQLILDNKEFDQNAKKSIQSLDDLKRALEFKNVSNNFASITKSAATVNLNPIATAVDTVSMKFDALTTIADSALRNITNSAVNYGSRLIKSLSVDNIASGWQKFSDKTTSVATLVSQGYDMSEVNEQLNRLNWYTDETSYNFTDMVSNIAKFTASGKGLTESVTAMEGIANWAALSGQNARTASAAMYQLSQAMGSGLMRREDWKSIVNANMDTQEFRQHALDAAVALGTLKKNADGTYQSLMVYGKGAEAFTKNQFIDSLTEGEWFTSDVMMKTFNDYSAAVDKIYEYTQEHGVTAAQAIKDLGDEVDVFGLKAFNAAGEARTWADVLDSVKDAVSTGWMKTFELIFGDYEEAKELFTDAANSLYDVFTEGVNQRNLMLSEWKDMGGRAVLLEGLYKGFSDLWSIITAVKDAFHDVFPPITADILYNITAGFTSFIQAIAPTPDTLSMIHTAFKGVFDIFGLFANILKAAGSAMSPLISFGLKLATVILAIASDLGHLLSLGVDKLYDIGALNKLYDILNAIATKIAEVGATGLDKFVEIFIKLSDIAKDIYNEFKMGEGGISGFFDVIKNGIDKVIPNFGNLEKETSDTTSAIGKLFGFVRNVFTTVFGILDAFVDTIFGAQNDTKSVVNSVINVIQNFFNWLTNMMNNISFGELASVGIVAAFAYMAINIGKIGKSISNTFESIGSIFDRFGGKGDEDGILGKASKVGKILLMIGASISLLVNALTKLSALPVDQLAVGLLGMGAILAGLIVVIDKMGEIGKNKNAVKSIQKIGPQILVMSAGLNILSTAIVKIGSLPITSAIQGLIAIEILMVSMSTFANSISKLDKKGILAASASLILMTTGLTMMVAPIFLLGSMPTDSLIQGLLGLSGALVVIGVAMKAISDLDVKSVIAASASMTIMSTGLIGISLAIGILGSLSFESLAIGVLGLSSMLIALVVACKQLTGINVASLLSSSVAINGFAIALIGCSAALKLLSTIKPEEMLPGLLALISLIAVLTGSMTLLGNIGGMGAVGILAASEGMIAVAAAMNLMIPPLLAFESITWESIGKGMLVLVGALAAFGAAATLATFVAPGLLVLSAVFLSFGAGIALAASSILKMVEAIALVMTAAQVFGDDLPELFSSAIELIKMAILELILFIPSMAPGLVLAAASIIGAMIEGITMMIPDIFALLLKLLTGIVNTLVEFGPTLVDGIISLINIVTASLPKIRVALAAFFDALLVNLLLLAVDMIESLVDTTLALFVGLFTGKSVEEVLTESGKEVGEYTAGGVVEGVESKEDDLKQAGANAYDKVHEGYRERAGIHSNSDEMIENGEFTTGGLLEGIEDAYPDLYSAGEGMGNSVLSGAASSLETGLPELDNLIKGFMRKYAVRTPAGDYSRYDTQASESALARAEANYKKYKEISEKLDSEDTNEAYSDVGAKNGESYSKGVGSGAKKEKEKTAEEIIDEHLKAINDAYSRGVKQLDLASSRLDLKDKLWNLMNKEPGEEDTAAQAAYEAAKKEHELEMLDAQMEIQLGKINEAQAKYTDKLKLLGSSAAETQEEYNNLLEQQYKILELYSEKQELMTEQSDSSADAFIAASKEVSSYHELLEQGLITEEMYLSAAQNKLAAFRKEESDLQKEHTTQLDNSLAAVLERLEQNGGDLKDAFGAIMSDTLVDAIHNLPDNSEELSWSMTKVVSDGLEQVYLDPNFKESTEGLGVNIVDGAVNGLDDAKGTFVKVSGSVAKEGLEEMADELGVASPSKKTYLFGQWIDDGLVNGILNRKAKVLEAAIAVAKGAIKAAKEALGIASPSKEFTAIGVLSDLGLARGLENGSDQVMKTSKKLVTNLLATTKDELDQNGKYVSDYLKNTFGVSDETLRLQVIVDADTSLADASINELQRAYALKTGSLGAVDTAATFNAGSTDYLLQKLNEQEAFRATKLQSMYDLMASYVEMERLKSFEKSQGSEDSSTTIVNYNQTNVSPKPISALDTYRNTKKQLDTFETKIKGKKTYRV